MFNRKIVILTVCYFFAIGYFNSYYKNLYKNRDHVIFCDSGVMVFRPPQVIDNLLIDINTQCSLSDGHKLQFNQHEDPVKKNNITGKWENPPWNGTHYVCIFRLGSQHGVSAKEVSEILSKCNFTNTTNTTPEMPTTTTKNKNPPPSSTEF